MERKGKREITVLKSTANQKPCTHTHTPTQLKISAPMQCTDGGENKSKEKFNSNQYG